MDVSRKPESQHHFVDNVSSEVKGTEVLSCYKQGVKLFNFRRFGSTKVIFNMALLILLMSFLGYKATQTERSANQSQQYIEQPEINDIYFLDFRLMSDALRPKEKYRLAKIVDITGDIITFRYGNMFYVNQQAAIDGIRYGQLRYQKYLEPKRYDVSTKDVQALWQSGAIYMVKRPVNNELFGNYVSADSANFPSASDHVYIPGKREHIAAQSLMKALYNEQSLSQAIILLNQSVELGYAPAQVSLAEAYLVQGPNAFYEKDLVKALFWFKQAALQSHKPGVLKYVIVCKQVPSCNVVDFYDELLAAGVNLKVRKHQFSLSTL